MLFFTLAGKMYRGYGTKSWHRPALTLAIGFIVGWLGMWIFEPQNPMVLVRNFYWFAYVQGTTVGFGDFFPTTFGGRVPCIFMGVMTIRAVTQFINISIAKRRRREDKRLDGVIRLYAKDIRLDLVVVIGYDRSGASRTERIVDEVLDGCSRQVVVLDNRGSESKNPFMLYDQTRLAYLTVVQLDTELAMKQACVALAKSVIICVPDPFLASSIAQFVNACNPRAHIVVGLENLELHRNGFKSQKKVVCLHSDDPVEMASEACAPHSAGMVAEFMNRKGPALRTFQISAALGAGTLSYDQIHKFMCGQRAILVAIMTSDGTPAPDIFAAQARQGWWIGYLSTADISPGTISAQLLNS